MNLWRVRGFDRRSPWRTFEVDAPSSLAALDAAAEAFLRRKEPLRGDLRPTEEWVVEPLR